MVCLMAEENSGKEIETLYTRMTREFVDGNIIYLSPEIRMAQESGEVRVISEWSRREFRFLLFGGLDRAINAHVKFVDDKKPEENDIFLHKLYDSVNKDTSRVSKSGKPLTFIEELERLVKGRVYITPEIMAKVSSDETGYDMKGDFSIRPYRFEEMACADVPLCAEIVYLDGKEPRRYSPVLSKLLRSEEMPAEEVAKRMKKKIEGK